MSIVIALTHLFNIKISKMKNFSFCHLVLVAHCELLFGQQASCRAKLEVDAPDFSCSVTITPEMINYGSSNYDDLIVLNGIVGFPS